MLCATRTAILGGFDTQPLQVMQRFVARRGLEAAHEVADAHAVFARDVFKAEFVGEVLFEPMLDLQDDHVLVQLLPAKSHAPRCVAALDFVQDVSRNGLRHVGAAESLDQVDIEIARRDGAACAIQVVGVGQVFFLIEQHIREAIRELIEETPVGGRLLAIEQTGFGQPEHAAGFAARRRLGRAARATRAESADSARAGYRSFRRRPEG